MKTAILVDGGFYRSRARLKLGAPIKEDLFEHIDGLMTCNPKFMNGN